MSRSAVLLCPGRGSYTASELGYLSRPAPKAAAAELDAAVARVDDRRSAHGDLTLRGMDRASAFAPAFFAGENASEMTFACTAFDFLRLDARGLDIVAVGGNSMGWYSALHVAGVFDLENAFELVETMGAMARDGQIGGQIIYPIVDDDWRADQVAAAHVDAALASVRDAGHAGGWSIRYGAYGVLWGDSEATALLLEHLPETTHGGRKYPFQLPLHSAFHSPLMQASSQRGLELLSRLPWRAPSVPLIDGRGCQWRPLTTDPAALYAYTLTEQVLETFDFSTAVRVALREYAPDLFVLLGPGDTLGAAVAAVIVAERWQGVDSRQAFIERQKHDPLLISMGRPEQAEPFLLPAAPRARQ